MPSRLNAEHPDSWKLCRVVACGCGCIVHVKQIRLLHIANDIHGLRAANSPRHGAQLGHGGHGKGAVFLLGVSGANQVVELGVGTDTGFSAATNVVIAIARIAAIALGAVLALRGQVTMGTLVAFLGYLGRANRRIRNA